MDDCGVCIGGEVDSNDFDKWETTANRNYRCCECGEVILAGTTHEFAHWKEWREPMETARTCRICAEIAWAFSCEARMYMTLWEQMESIFDSLNSACFDKLQTPEAKAELRRRWMEWKGLSPRPIEKAPIRSE